MNRKKHRQTSRSRKIPETHERVVPQVSEVQELESSGQVQSRSVPDPLEPWRKRHALYLDDAKGRIAHTRNVLLVMFAALVTMWLGGIQKAVSRMDALLPAAKEAVEARKLLARTNVQLKEVEESAAPLLRELKASELSPERKGMLDEMRGHLAKLEEKANKLKEEKEAAASKLHEKLGDGVNIKILGFEFPISPILSSSIWLLLVVGMIGYILAARRGIYRSLGRALHIERHHLSVPGDERLVSVPWWLDPLPTATTEGKSALELDLAIGWRPRPHLCSVAAFVAGSLLITSVSFILIANRQLISDCADKSLGEWNPGLKTPTWQLNVAKIAPGVLIAAGVALIAYWRRAVPIFDHFVGETLSAVRSRSIGRRRFVNVAFAAACGTLAGLVWWKPGVSLPRAASRRGISRPRSRSSLLAKLRRIRARRETPVKDVKPSFAYLNSSADAPRIHISTPRSSFRFPKRPKAFKEEIINFAEFQPQSTKDGKRIALAEAGWALELKAIEAANEKRFSDACDILLCAVRHDLLLTARKPSFRLYDLLAGLSVRGRTDHLIKLTALLEASPLRPAFRDRIRTWSDSNSRWRRRWVGETKSKRTVWQASVADAKDKDAQKKVLRLSISS